MKIPCCLFLFFFLLASCTPITPASTETLLPSLTPAPITPQTETLLPSLTPAQITQQSETPIPSPTFTQTPIPPTLAFTETPSPTPENTLPPTGEFPGVQVSGTVTLPDGSPIPNAQVYFALSAGPYSTLLSTTNSQGQYEGFINIPHQEIVRVWAELPGYSFKPGDANRAWVGGEFGWQYYGGSEFANLNFIGTPN